MLTDMSIWEELTVDEPILGCLFLGHLNLPVDVADKMRTTSLFLTPVFKDCL